MPSCRERLGGHPPHPPGVGLELRGLLRLFLRSAVQAGRHARLLRMPLLNWTTLAPIARMAFAPLVKSGHLQTVDDAEAEGIYTDYRLV